MRLWSVPPLLLVMLCAWAGVADVRAADDPGKLHLHRLRMRFNREDYARLRQMIDVINAEELSDHTEPIVPERRQTKSDAELSSE